MIVTGGNASAAAAIADNVLVRGDGGAKGVQGSTATLADDGNLTLVKTTAGGNSNILFLNNADATTSTAGSLVWANSATPTALSAIIRATRTNSPSNGATQLGFLVNNGSTNPEALRLNTDGSVATAGTVTAGGTTGAQTIDKTTGQVNFAAAATSLVVTNALATAPGSYIVLATAQANDTTGRVIGVVKGTGSFTIHVVAPTAEMPVAWELRRLY